MWVVGQTESKSSTLFTADAETILVWMRPFAGIFHIFHAQVRVVLREYIGLLMSENNIWKTNFFYITL